MRRLLLVRHAPTAATRQAAFPADEELDADARTRAAALAGALPASLGAPLETVCSPALRCRQTAAAAGLVPSIEPRLAECDFGAWAGRSLAALHASDPEGVGRWMNDPDAAPHGGESLRELLARVSGWLVAEQSRLGEGTVVAITHGGVIKACVVHALAAPVAAFWRIEIEPLTIAELHLRGGSWSLIGLGRRLAEQA